MLELELRDHKEALLQGLFFLFSPLLFQGGDRLRDSCHGVTTLFLLFFKIEVVGYEGINRQAADRDLRLGKHVEHVKL